MRVLPSRDRLNGYRGGSKRGTRRRRRMRRRNRRIKQRKKKEEGEEEEISRTSFNQMLLNMDLTVSKFQELHFTTFLTF